MKRIVPSVLLFLLALTTVFRAHQVIVWKLSLLATEFGHWFAMVGLVLIATMLADKKMLPWVALVTVSIALFVRPVAYAASQHPDLFSFRKLWTTKKNPVIPKTLVYAETKDGALSLDFYPATSIAPAPWVLMVHGGGWDSGDKSQLPELNWMLAQEGYAVAAISYRLAPKSQWPAPREDALEAAKYLKEHAQELNLDPKRWAVMGRSAGGQIAEAVAFQTKDPTLKGLIAYHAPANMKFAYDFSSKRDIINSRDLLKNFVGGDPDQVPEAYHDSSPINFVTKESPPTLLIHGRIDPLTWVEQSRRLTAKMKDVGARCTYIELPWATHAFDYSLNGPGGQISSHAVKIFLASVLRSS